MCVVYIKIPIPVINITLTLNMYLKTNLKYTDIASSSAHVLLAKYRPVMHQFTPGKIVPPVKFDLAYANICT